MSSIRTILKAKLSKKDNMPDWYYERLEKCIGCEHNTGNIQKLSFIDRVRTAHNFGKDACVKCTCGVEDKASVDTEQCPDNPPRWLSLFPNNLKLLRIRNNSTRVASVSYSNTEKAYIVDYGTLRKSGNTAVELFIEVGKNTINNLRVKSSCGCTTASPVKLQGGYLLKIEYDSRRIGSIGGKQVTLNYDKNGEAATTLIKLIGIINN